MSTPVFTSKSRRTVKTPEVKIVYREVPPSPVIGASPENAVVIRKFVIAWIGHDFPRGDAYGFTNIDISKQDISVLVNVSLLCVMNTFYSNKVSSIINFAFEYGVPILWINKEYPPKDKIWFFKDYAKSISWELICQIAK